MRSRPERSSSREGRKKLRGSSLVRNKKLGVVRVAADPSVGRTGLLKLCVTKLARMSDPESKLCRAVLINNTLRKCQAKQQPCCHEDEREEEEIEEDQLHSVEEVKREGEVLVERMKMCQDIMDDYLDLINNSEEKSEKTCDRTFEESNPSGLADFDKDFVSPYSYNSFLSEVYEESISRILKKVDK